ncbi:hypothetical protein [Tenacibaculum sp. M341]|uniref:hypothetical protein n=1 Tax=Tenacibaculum sp. M341 TaxID=2530339 RepID=UPI00104DFB0B|nr:hypothetical protein [Tenacibaculum sp. M341]TCI91516.1 hypothetical protein EYW44_11245 [Tenacibaculum sp. M341]
MRIKSVLVFCLIILVNFGCKNNQETNDSGSNNKKVKKKRYSDEGIYPKIKRRGWLKENEGAMYAEFPLESKVDSFPIVITFGFDNGHFVIDESNKDGRTEKEIVDLAFENIDNFESEISISKNMAFASGNYLSCEKILSKSHLINLQKELNTNEIYVSIPREMCMYAIAKDAAEDDMFNFMTTHAFTWADYSYGNKNICELIIHVKDGNIQGFVEVPKEAMDLGRELFEGKSSGE